MPLRAQFKRKERKEVEAKPRLYSYPVMLPLAKPDENGEFPKYLVPSSGQIQDLVLKLDKSEKPEELVKFSLILKRQGGSYRTDIAIKAGISKIGDVEAEIQAGDEVQLALSDKAQVGVVQGLAVSFSLAGER